MLILVVNYAAFDFWVIHFQQLVVIVYAHNDNAKKSKHTGVLFTSLSPPYIYINRHDFPYLATVFSPSFSWKLDSVGFCVVATSVHMVIAALDNVMPSCVLSEAVFWQLYWTFFSSSFFFRTKDNYDNWSVHSKRKIQLCCILCFFVADSCCGTLWFQQFSSAPRFSAVLLCCHACSGTWYVGSSGCEA